MQVFVSVVARKKQKSLLRKLKVSFGRKRRQEEAKVLNRQFKEDPCRVYATTTMMAEEDPDNARLKYKVARNEDQTSASKGVFSDTVEAEGFWRRLWEERGTGDENAEWLKEIELAISQRVPLPTVGTWTVETNEAVKGILKKRNWSAPGPDRVVNYWWKRACTLHEGFSSAFKTITRSSCAYPKWFTEGKTRLIPKQGDFTSENQHPITCLNTSYKWFTSCVLVPMDKHLKVYDLMEKQQRGAKAGCSGTTDNLQIDRTVTLDCHRHKRNLSVAWVDVRKAYDSVDHRWLNKVMLVHRVPVWICEVVRKLCSAWNTGIVANTKVGNETSPVISFNRGLPQGDARCRRLFTLCLNPVAWKLCSTEGYRLSRPVGSKVTNLLYIDDLKVFAASQAKLNIVLKMTKEAMEDIGLQWNPKKCNVLKVRSCVPVIYLKGSSQGRRSSKA